VLSQSELEKLIAKQLRLGPPVEISSADPTKVLVFIEHHLGEAEVSVESLRIHLRITGKIPAPGENLMALPPGSAHKAFAIPIGKVIRIESKK